MLGRHLVKHSLSLLRPEDPHLTAAATLPLSPPSSDALPPPRRSGPHAGHRCGRSSIPRVPSAAPGAARPGCELVSSPLRR